MIGYLITAAVGILCVILGIRIRVRQDISLIHDYHTEHILPEHIPAYTRRIGTGLLLIGAGLCVTGVLCVIFGTLPCWIAAGIGTVCGCAVMVSAQKYHQK